MGQEFVAQRPRRKLGRRQRETLEARFIACVIAVLEEYRGRRVDPASRQREYVIATVYGDLLVTPYGGWIACHFRDIEAAKPLLSAKFGGGNHYSGKWNFGPVEYGDYATRDGMLSLLMAFEFSLIKILPDDVLFWTLEAERRERLCTVFDRAVGAKR